MVTDGNETCRGDHLVTYRNTGLLCYAPETNRVVTQLYYKNRQANKIIEKEISPVVTRGGR